MRAWLTALMVLSLALGACAGVLGLKPGAPAHPFEHRAHVLKGINCIECHTDMEHAGDDGLPHLPSRADCVRCHTKPHDDRPCMGCHGERYVRQAVDLARRDLRFDHAKHVLPAKGDCVRCHVEVTESRPEAVLPKMGSCFGCHEHQDQWTLRDCNGCHVDLAAEQTPPDDHLIHDGDFLHEHGIRAASARDLCASCHSERSCAACHGEGTVPALPARLAFDDVRLSGLHRAGFSSRHSDEARADPGACTTCHSESSCVDCHTREHVAAGSTSVDPHPADWVVGPGGGEHGTQARIDPASCAGCHGGAGEQLCVGCHRVGGPGGNPHGHGFASTKNKGRDLPCRLCHGGGL